MNIHNSKTDKVKTDPQEFVRLFQTSELQPYQMEILKRIEELQRDSKILVRGVYR